LEWYTSSVAPPTTLTKCNLWPSNYISFVDYYQNTIMFTSI